MDVPDTVVLDNVCSSECERSVIETIYVKSDLYWDIGIFLPPVLWNSLIKSCLHVFGEPGSEQSS